MIGVNTGLDLVMPKKRQALSRINSKVPMQMTSSLEK